ncbi:MAG: zinc ribbon domain-containing protein [Acidobacteriota bacterium]|jgi:putative FmdB family regulatory protein|nr:zinc ribbon domain-containing protein [Acidobacteriota bacterium]
MPIYEYLCRKCNRKMSYLVMTPATFEPECKFCRSADVEQLFSRFASPKSEEARMEALADPSTFSGLDENDPGSVARWVKKMGSELGDDFGDGQDLEQMADEAAREAAAGGLGGAEGAGAASDDL